MFLFFGVTLGVVGASFAAANNTTKISDTLNNRTGIHYTSIQGAINDAQSGDTIIVNPGNYSENLQINKNINLIGSDEDNTIIDGGGLAKLEPVILINKGTVSISGFTIQNGFRRTLGGGICNNGFLTVINCTIIKNRAPEGAGIYNEGNLIVINCSILNNTGIIGGGMENDRGTCTVSNSLIQSNSGRLGAGITNIGGGTCTVTESIFEDNSAAQLGGGITNIESSSLTVNDTIFYQNIGGNGGGIHNGNGATCVVGNCIFTRNSVSQYGGGIYTTGTCTVINSTIQNNAANALGYNGGGIFFGGVIFVINSTISGNINDDCYSNSTIGGSPQVNNNSITENNSNDPNLKSHLVNNDNNNTKIRLQNTGLPLNYLILAILLVITGLTTSKIQKR